MNLERNADYSGREMFGWAWNPGETRSENLRENFADEFAKKLAGNFPKFARPKKIHPKSPLQNLGCTPRGSCDNTPSKKGS